MSELFFVEDEIDLGNVIKQYLEITGFQVEWKQNGKDAFDLITQEPHKYDLVIIDVSIPEMDGFELAEHIHNINANLPFIFLTARSGKEDRIKGLKIGADDYITKPFDIDELVLRIKNIIKRATPAPDVETVKETEASYQKGDILFNKNQLTLVVNGTGETMLTIREAELLEYMFQHQNIILKREDILLQLWGKNDYFLGRSLDVFVSRLRKYLSASRSVSIHNVYGVGFIFKTS